MLSKTEKLFSRSLKYALTVPIKKQGVVLIQQLKEQLVTDKKVVCICKVSVDLGAPTADNFSVDSVTFSDSINCGLY